MVHTIAPRAALTILLVKGNSLDSADQAVTASIAALRMGAKEGGIISLSPAGQIGGEHCVTHTQLEELNNALRTDAHHHVTVVAATGDSGAAGEPCALIDALSAGISQQLHPHEEKSPSFPQTPSSSAQAARPSARTRPTGAWTGETAWGLPDGTPGTGFQASGGGFSHLFLRPSYQNAVHGIRSMRGVPDVAADANPNPGSGVPVVTSNAGAGYTISEHGGTSASAPIWAGIIALADQYAKRHLGLVNPAIYRIARSPHYHQAFHDITNGSRNTAKFPPRHDQRLPSRPRLGPRHRLGQPEREGARTPTRFPGNPLAAASRVPASDQRGWVVRSTVPSC